MGASYYNRYTDFTVDGKHIPIPYIPLKSKSTDKKIIYKVGRSRLDKISALYYDTPYFGWLILQANPAVGGLEWNIKDGQVLIVPYPLVASLQEYKKGVDEYFFFYGKNLPTTNYNVPEVGNKAVIDVGTTPTGIAF
jgi:hypothetical protein